MPPHIVWRKGKSGRVAYLVDGRHRESLHTDNKGIAEHHKKQYILGQHGIRKLPTVKEYYEKWIETKKPPLYRKSLVRAYKYAFGCYILSEFRDVGLMQLSVPMLLKLRSSLLTQGLSLKSTKNILTSFQAFWRDASNEFEELKARNPFASLEWPRVQRQRPDPFTAEEKQKILTWFSSHEPFYHPWVFVMFETGMRPSEASALTWEDIDFENQTISITKSRDRQATGATKSENSVRTIVVGYEVIQAFKKLHAVSVALGQYRSVFINKYGQTITQDHFRAQYWPQALKKLQIRYRSAYAMRPTFVTLELAAGKNFVAVAQYIGDDPVTMFRHYCGKVELSAGIGSQPSGNGLTMSPVDDPESPRHSPNMPQGPEKPAEIKKSVAGL